MDGGHLEAEVGYPMSAFVRGLVNQAEDRGGGPGGASGGGGVLGRGSEAEGFGLREQVMRLPIRRLAPTPLTSNLKP